MQIREITLMKKSLIATLLLSPGLFFAQFQSNSIKVSIDENGIGYQFPNCISASSVCGLFPKDNSPKDSKVMAYRSNGTTLILQINKDFLTDEKQVAVMGKLLRDIKENEEIMSRMDVDFPLSSEFLRALNIDKSLNTIKAGNYPVQITEQHILLQFEMISK